MIAMSPYCMHRLGSITVLLSRHTKGHQTKETFPSILTYFDPQPKSAE